MANTQQQTVWSEYFAPDATSDRGWLKAICEPYDWNRHMEYTSETTPVWDEDINGWREQSTLGNYFDYGQRGIHCICYLTSGVQWVSTVAEARAWIESEAQRARPNLVFQQQLVFAA